MPPPAQSSPNGTVDTAKELGELMKQFGDGHKAWIMTHTIERLKEAQQRGKFEVDWQQ